MNHSKSQLEELYDLRAELEVQMNGYLDELNAGAKNNPIGQELDHLNGILEDVNIEIEKIEDEDISIYPEEAMERIEAYQAFNSALENNIQSSCRTR